MSLVLLLLTLLLLLEVCWQTQRRKNKSLRKKKKGWSWHHPLSLDYSNPKSHPPNKERCGYVTCVQMLFRNNCCCVSSLSGRQKIQSVVTRAKKKKPPWKNVWETVLSGQVVQPQQHVVSPVVVVVI